MASVVRYTAFLLLGLLLLSSVAPRHSVVHAHPAAENGVATDVIHGGSGPLAGRREGPRDGKMPTGRKLSAEGNGAAKRETKKVKSPPTPPEQDATAAAAAAAGNCDGDGSGEGEPDVGCGSTGVSPVDFMAFSADYRGAATHPPRNN